jgi:hypothetical protein
MVKSLLEFIIEGLVAIGAVYTVIKIFGFTLLGYGITALIVFVLMAIYYTRNLLDLFQGDTKTKDKTMRTSAHKHKINQTIHLNKDDYQPYDFLFEKETSLKVIINANKPINLYVLDKWHLDREEYWDTYDSRSMDIRTIDEIRVIPNNELRNIVVEGIYNKTEVKIKISPIG